MPSADGVEKISFYGYEDCLSISNASTRVVLCPAAGGRVLEYSLNGKNVLYLPPGNEGWVWDGGTTRGQMDAGRFDIGPEQKVPSRLGLWQGRWQSEIIGARSVRLISESAPAAGVRLERVFQLAAEGSRLQCTQTIVHTGEEPVEYCHWSRTFALGDGVCVVPLSRHSKFRRNWVRYDPPGRMLNMDPIDPKVEEHDGFLVITNHPKYPKLGFDSTVGWLAYYAPNDLLFVKKFPVYPDRAYNEVAGLTISIWYPGRNMVELEPIGPRERLSKKQSRASFTEVWYLLDERFPDDEPPLTQLQRQVDELSH